MSATLRLALGPRVPARDPESLARVKQQIDRGVSIGVPREPGLFVNGLFVSGLVPYEELRDVVRAELERLGSPATAP